MVPIVLAACAVAGLIIAAWQLWLKIEQHRREKKERARPAVDAYREFLRCICQQRGVSQQELDQYWQAVHKDLRLFNRKRRRLLKEVYEKATEAQFVKTQKENHRNDENDDEFQIYVEEEHKLMIWFSKRFGNIDKDF